MDWINVKDKLPDEGGRYLGWVIELNELGLSEFPWNVSYSQGEWSDNLISYKVTHWMPLPEKPNN